MDVFDGSSSSSSSSSRPDSACQASIYGHPKFQHHVEVAFWKLIARRLLAKEAAGLIGVAPAVGARWFHNAGCMPPVDLTFQSSCRCLSFADREEIAPLKPQDKGVREIARAIGRDPGTISRELPILQDFQKSQRAYGGVSLAM